MKRNTKVALIIAAAFFLFITIVFVYADKQFEQSGEAVRLAIEFKSNKAKQLEDLYASTIEELEAINKDLTNASILNHRIQTQADSTILLKEAIIRHQKTQIKNKDEKIDSLTAVIGQFRQSDI